MSRIYSEKSLEGLVIRSKAASANDSLAPIVLASRGATLTGFFPEGEQEGLLPIDGNMRLQLLGMIGDEPAIVYGGRSVIEGLESGNKYLDNMKGAIIGVSKGSLYLRDKVGTVFQTRRFDRFESSPTKIAEGYTETAAKLGGHDFGNYEFRIKDLTSGGTHMAPVVIDALAADEKHLLALARDRLFILAMNDERLSIDWELPIDPPMPTHPKDASAYGGILIAKSSEADGTIYRIDYGWSIATCRELERDTGMTVDAAAVLPRHQAERFFEGLI